MVEPGYDAEASCLNEGSEPSASRWERLLLVACLGGTVLACMILAVLLLTALV